MVNCENEGSYKMKKQIENTIYSIDEEGNVYGKNNKVLKVRTKTGQINIMFNDGIRRSITPKILKHEYFNYSNYTDKPMKQIENSTYLIDEEGNVYNKYLKLLKVRKTGKVGIYSQYVYIILNDGSKKCIFTKKVSAQMFM